MPPFILTHNYLKFDNQVIDYWRKNFQLKTDFEQIMNEC